MSGALAPGTNVGVLRKAHSLSQYALARRAGISHSLLSKIEVGDRTLTPAIAASIARALHVPLERIHEPFDPTDRMAELETLRSAVRRYDLPSDIRIDPDGLASDVSKMIDLRGDADIGGLMRLMPRLLRDATAHAFQSGSPQAWAILTDLYSAVYWLAARHRWMDLVEIASERQRWAASQRDNPLSAAIAARDRAGIYLNTGDFEGGLAIVDRAVVTAESALGGIDRAYATGILHLRGMTLAGRIKDRETVRAHREASERAAQAFPDDVHWHGLTFGPDNTASHVLATLVDMEKHREALTMIDDLRAAPLPPTRKAPVYMNSARAELALGDRDEALNLLADAWRITPQMMRVHPTALEVLRVLYSLHRRSNPTLIELVKSAGLLERAG